MPEVRGKVSRLDEECGPEDDGEGASVQKFAVTPPCLLVMLFFFLSGCGFQDRRLQLLWDRLRAVLSMTDRADSLRAGPEDMDDVQDPDAEAEASDEEAYGKILKVIAFPPEIERADVTPSTLVHKVSRAINKRILKLQGHRDALTSANNQTQVLKTPPGWYLSGILLCFVSRCAFPCRGNWRR